MKEVVSVNNWIAAITAFAECVTRWENNRLDGPTVWTFHSVGSMDITKSAKEVNATSPLLAACRIVFIVTTTIFERPDPHDLSCFRGHGGDVLAFPTSSRYDSYANFIRAEALLIS